MAFALPVIPLSVASAGALGVAGSPHCLAMCGPLACTAAFAPEARFRATLAHHLGRAVAYALAGALVAGVGHHAARTLGLGSFSAALPWLVAALLVGQAAWFLLGRAGVRARLPSLPRSTLPARAASRIVERAAGLPEVSRAFSLGAVSPLLPCGLSASALALAFASDDALTGAATLAAFALASAPGLLVAQFAGRLLPRRVLDGALVRVGLPLAAAAFIVVRVIGTSPSCH